jgi:hypothetical protein
MIEPPRKHGHFDRRWHRLRPQRHVLLPAAAGNDGPSIDRWENEGGRYSIADAVPTMLGLIPIASVS